MAGRGEGIALKSCHSPPPRSVSLCGSFTHRKTRRGGKEPAPFRVVAPDCISIWPILSSGEGSSIHMSGRAAVVCMGGGHSADQRKQARARLCVSRRGRGVCPQQRIFARPLVFNRGLLQDS